MDMAFDILHWIIKPRESQDLEEIVLFRGIKKPHKFWRLTVGNWWSGNPYVAYHYLKNGPYPYFWHAGMKPEMYIATLSIGDYRRLEELRRVYTMTRAKNDGSRLYSDVAEIQFNAFNRRFTSMRMVKEEEIEKLASLELRKRWEEGENPVNIAREVFPIEYKNAIDPLNLQ